MMITARQPRDMSVKCSDGLVRKAKTYVEEIRWMRRRQSHKCGDGGDAIYRGNMVW